MVKEKEIKYSLRRACLRLASVMLAVLFAVLSASAGFAYAAKETEPEEPIREVHNVGVVNDAYCFFVTHNVVLTPAEVAGMTDEELTYAILERAGLFMIKANCKAASHKTITMEDWIKKDGAFFLSEPDIAGIRAAEPVEGEPVKFYMDLLIAQDTKEDAEEEASEEADEEGEEPDEDGEEPPLYSTYKRTSPRLLFAVVATEEDAKLGEDICKEDRKPEPGFSPGFSGTEAPEDEMLPEYRTINMVDRSGAPLEKTLADGSPVSLEWIEPKKAVNGEGLSWIDHIPGGPAGLAAMAAAAAAATAVIVIAAKRRHEDD